MSTPPPPPPWAFWYEGVRRPAGRPDFRVSDAERAAVGDVLAKHYADGRLDDAEFRERIDRAMAAKTRSDLAGLTTDLPPLDPPAAHPAPVPRHRLGEVLGVVLVACIALSALSWLTPGPHIPWVLVLVVGLLLWRRFSWRWWHRHHPHSHPSP